MRGRCPSVVFAASAQVDAAGVHHTKCATDEPDRAFGVVVADTFYVTRENGLRPDEGELDLLCANLTALVTDPTP